jgi:hypothetical protein
MWRGPARKRRVFIRAVRRARGWLSAGNITREKLNLLRWVDAVDLDEVRKAGVDGPFARAEGVILLRVALRCYTSCVADRQSTLELYPLH